MLLSAISLFLILFSVIIIVLGIVKVHEYPTKVAKARNHPQVEGITTAAVLGLILFPLWMFALIWAYGGVIGQPLKPIAASAPPEPPKPKPAEKDER